MNNVRKNVQMNNRLLTMTLFLMVFYALWGFVFKFTIYGSQSITYSFLLLLFLISLFCVGKFGSGKLTKSGLAWLPFFVYTLAYLTFSLLFQASNFTLFIEWFACFFIVLTATNTPLLDYFPVKFIMWSGFFAIFGIAVQALLPSFYYSNIAGIFINEDTILGWVEHDFGLSGFTSQIAITARILIYGEIILLFMKDIILPKWMQNKFSFYLLVFLFVFCVLLTGKRLHFLVAVSLPFIIHFLSEKDSAKKNMILLITIILFIFIGELLIMNIEYFMQSSMFHRLAESYAMAQAGEDITSGRTEMYEAAWKAFHDSPIFGIGMENFSSYTGIDHYVHNTYLQTLCERGIVGIILFVLALYKSISNTIKLIKKVKIDKYLRFLKISLGIQIFYILYCFTGNEHYGAGLVMYFLAIAILVNIESLHVKYNNCIK